MVKSKWETGSTVAMVAACVLALARSFIDSKRQEEQIEKAVKERLQELETEK